MFTAIAAFVTGLFSPVQKIIDRTVTTEKDRLELTNELAKIQGDVQAKLIGLQEKALEADVKIREAEYKSGYWLASNWRPLCSIISFGLILASSFKLCVLDDKVMNIFELFLGTYAGGRSLEKISSSISAAITKK